MFYRDLLQKRPIIWRSLLIVKCCQVLRVRESWWRICWWMSSCVGFWHVYKCHGTHMDESCHICEWVMSHVWMSHVTYMNVSCHSYGSCHTYECVPSHTLSCDSTGWELFSLSQHTKKKIEKKIGSLSTSAWVCILMAYMLMIGYVCGGVTYAPPFCSTARLQYLLRG